MSAHVILVAGGEPAIAATELVDNLTGVVTYTVEGDGVYGQVGFYPFLAFNCETAAKNVLVVSGVSPGGVLRRNHLSQRLRVDGVEVEFTYVLHPDGRNNEHPRPDIYERGDIRRTSPLPATVLETAELIVENLIGIWLGRGDAGDLLRVASLAGASERHQHELITIRQLSSTIVDLDQELIAAQERAGTFAMQAAEYQNIVDATRGAHRS